MKIAIKKKINSAIVLKCINGPVATDADLLSIVISGKSCYVSDRKKWLMKNSIGLWIEDRNGVFAAAHAILLVDIYNEERMHSNRRMRKFSRNGDFDKLKFEKKTDKILANRSFRLRNKNNRKRLLPAVKKNPKIAVSFGGSMQKGGSI